MTQPNTDPLFKDIKDKLEDIQGKAHDLGIPLKKFDDELREIKKKMLIKWILRKREEKHSYKQIEDLLNEAGVPTLSGKGRWNSQTISNMLKEK